MIWWCFSTLCLQVGHRLRFWGGFSCFVCFIWCQLFACLIRAAIFRLPSRFVVWSFFLCHRHLWSFFLSFFFLSFLSQAFVSYLHGLFCCLCLLSFLMSSDAKEHIRDKLRCRPNDAVRVPLFFPKPCTIRWCTGQPSFCLPFGFYFSLGCFH